MSKPDLHKAIILPFGIHIIVASDCTTLSSSLHEELIDPPPAEDAAGAAATHAVESLLLALASRGVALEQPAAALAVQDAVEAVADFLSRQ